MTICFIAPANNYHTKKWCCWFRDNGYEVHVISFIDSDINGVAVHYIDTGSEAQQSDIKKIKYLFAAGKIRKIIRQIKPGIINAHYASSYGAATALAGIKPYFLSIWGTDIYDFPRKSLLHKTLIEISLAKADYLFSTSKAMAQEASKYTRKHFDITPFGVDMELFAPDKRTRVDKKDFIVGTVKTLAPKYGIDILLKAVAAVRDKRPDIPVQLRISGKGPYEHSYKELSRQLGIETITTWVGFISQAEVAKEWSNMDVAVIPSVLESESFGVSAVEAQACGTAVIISDIPGLMEATKPDVTSLVVPRKDVGKLAEAIIYLYDNPQRRVELGSGGRRFVYDNYEIDRCFIKVETIMCAKIKKNCYFNRERKQ